ncbi:MAG: EamA family transporter [Clostridiales bacterium]|nr:DMT family transporter [Eubacteriales bacterium]MDH7565420.1 EamA family transporter [Clostridiales bacterium]
MLLGEFQVKHSTAILLLVGTALLWSSGGVLIKLVSWNPIAIAGMRSAISALFLLILIRKPRFTWSFPQIAGALSYAATVTLFVSATKMTTAANAILLQYTAPIYVAVLGVWLLKEKIKIVDSITIVFTMGGMVLFFMDNLSIGGMTGNILAVFSGISFALLFIFSRMQKDGSPIETILLGNIITAVVSIPFMFGSMPGASSWLGLILLGVFQLGLAYVLYSIAIKQVTALEAILTSTLEPILNPIWVFLFLGEIPGPWALTGGSIVLVSITARSIITTLQNSKAPKSKRRKDIEV